VRPWPRQHDDRHVAVDALEFGERLEPIHTAGHDHVEDDGRGTLRVVPSDRLFRVAERDGGVSVIVEEGLEERTHRQVVVDDHHLGLTAEMHARHAVLSSNASASLTCG
jgi:hypothetical protein